MDLAAIPAALCEELRTIDNVRVYDGYQDAVFTGTGIAVVVRPGDPWVDYLGAMSGGQSTLRYVIEIAVQRANLRSAQTRLAELVSAGIGNTRSIYDAVKPDDLPQTLGGLVSDLVLRQASGMTDKQYGTFEYLGVDIDVEMQATRWHA